MKALILNGSLKEDTQMENVNSFIEEILDKKGYIIETVLLHEKEIGACTGCFGCWVRTPGVCVIDDYGRTLTRNIINSDIVIYLTPVVYGGYSSELKKALDRIIPLLLPFFKKVNGEIHHKERYAKYPKVIVLGMMKNEDKEMIDTFNNLIKRNALNWYNSFTGGAMDYNLEKVRDQLENVLNDVGVIIC